MMKINRKTYLLPNVFLLVFMVLTSCSSNNKKDFVWDEDVAAFTGKNLGNWLRQAPFGNELKQHEDDKVVFTNARQVFPFMGRYYSDTEELREGYTENDTVIFRQEEVLYKDPEWGDLFLHATLLYDGREVFLNNSYSQTGNVIFGGMDAAMDTHTASLYETSVFNKNDRYKTGIYWANTGLNRYLLGFYQQGQLVFETVVPLVKSDTLATLNKLKEINKKINLNVPQWENASVQQLRIADLPKSFWKDPFIGIYPGKYLSNQVHLKIKNTPFTQNRPAPKGDYYFSYPSPNGLVELYTVLKDTNMDEATFNKTHQEIIKGYRYRNRYIFYTEELSGNHINGTAKIYFKDKRYLEVHYHYPETDHEAKIRIHDMLKHIKTTSIY